MTVSLINFQEALDIFDACDPKDGSETGQGMYGFASINILSFISGTNKIRWGIEDFIFRLFPLALATLLYELFRQYISMQF